MPWLRISPTWCTTLHEPRRSCRVALLSLFSRPRRQHHRRVTAKARAPRRRMRGRNVRAVTVSASNSVRGLSRSSPVPGHPGRCIGHAGSWQPASDGIAGYISACIISAFVACGTTTPQGIRARMSPARPCHRRLCVAGRLSARGGRHDPACTRGGRGRGITVAFTARRWRHARGCRTSPATDTCTTCESRKERRMALSASLWDHLWHLWPTKAGAALHARRRRPVRSRGVSHMPLACRGRSCRGRGGRAAGTAAPGGGRGQR